MPAGEKGKEWQFFLVASEKANSRNYRVWCRACLQYQRSSIINSDPAYQVKQILTSEEGHHALTNMGMSSIRTSLPFPLPNRIAYLLAS